MKKTNIISLLYHEVTDHPTNSGFQRKNAFSYKHTVKEFRQHLLEINKFKNNVTTYMNIKEGKDNILLTFDDGGKSNMLIADMLEQFNFKGHFFISTSYIGKPHFLNKENIIDLHKRGHIIGSHSHTHPNVFKSLTESKMKEEWRNSMDILFSILNTQIKCCSIPGGDSNFLSYKTASLAGYQYIFNSEPKVSSEKIGKSIIFGRISFKTGESLTKLTNTLRLKGLNKLLLIRNFKTLLKDIFFPIYSRIHNLRKHEE